MSINPSQRIQVCVCVYSFSPLKYFIQRVQLLKFNCVLDCTYLVVPTQLRHSTTHQHTKSSKKYMQTIMKWQKIRVLHCLFHNKSVCFLDCVRLFSKCYKYFFFFYHLVWLVSTMLFE